MEAGRVMIAGQAIALLLSVKTAVKGIASNNKTRSTIIVTNRRVITQHMQL